MTVRLRLFARAREAAGCAYDDFDADDLGSLLAQARSRYGDEFAAVLETSRVWINGEPVSGSASAPVESGDEVAVLPPVSGG